MVGAEVPAGWCRSPSRGDADPPLKPDAAVVVRLLISALLHLGANAVGLLIAAVVLDGVEISAVSFVVAVLIFSGVEVLVQPLLVQMALKNARALAGGTALVATLIGLVVTDLLSDGLSIAGAGTFLAATVIVWAGGVIAAFLLPVVFLKRAAEERA